MRKILVIDDEKNIRMTLSTFLESEGYKVDIAMNGEEGLRRYGEEEYDVVLLDMKLPGKDGLEVLREIKADKNKDATVVMITGYSSVDSAVETMKLGAVDYLEKPFAPEEISQVVTQVIERRELDKGVNELESVDELLSFAKKAIHERDFDLAKQILNKTIVMEEKRAEAFNLLGVICELERDQGAAMKYYRTALALDPTYKPALANIERASQMKYSLEGLKLEEE